MPTIEDVLLTDDLDESAIEYYGLGGWKEKVEKNDCDGMVIIKDEWGWDTPFPFRKPENGGGNEIDDRTNPYDINIWEWKNPDEDNEKITLHPSLMKSVRGEEVFHGYVRQGSWVEI